MSELIARSLQESSPPGLSRSQASGPLPSGLLTFDSTNKQTT